MLTGNEIKFNVGDRVVHVGPLFKPYGKVGTVISVSRWSGFIDVVFDDFDQGHSINGLYTGVSGWTAKKTSLEHCTEGVNIEDLL